MIEHVVFLCARGSSRALLAASLLAHDTKDRFEVWSTPSQDEQSKIIVEQVLHEQGITPIPAGHFIQPAFGMHWDEGIILCSGASDT